MVYAVISCWKSADHDFTVLFCDFLPKYLTIDIKLTCIRMTLLFVLKHNFQTIINTESIIEAHNTPRSYWTCHTSHDCGKKYGISCFGIIVAFYFSGCRTFQPRNFNPKLRPLNFLTLLKGICYSQSGGSYRLDGWKGAFSRCKGMCKGHEKRCKGHVQGPQIW